MDKDGCVFVKDSNVSHMLTKPSWTLNYSTFICAVCGPQKLLMKIVITNLNGRIHVIINVYNVILYKNKETKLDNSV